MKKFKELKLLLGFIKEIKKAFLIALFFSFLNIAVRFTVSLLTICIATFALEDKVSVIPLFIVALGISIILHALFEYLDMYKFHNVAYLLIYKFRSKIYDAIERNAPLVTRKNRTGELNSIIMEDTETLELFYAHTINMYIGSFIFMLIVVIIAFIVEPVIAAIILFSSILLLIVPWTLFKRGHSLDTSIREQIATTNAEAIDTIQGLREILIFNQEEFFINKVKNHTKRLNKSQRQNGIRLGLQGAMIGFILTLANILVIFYSYTQLRANVITASAALFFIFIVPHALAPMAKLSDISSGLTEVFAAAQRVYALLLLPQNVLFNDHDDMDVEIPASVEFKNVTFSYEEKSPVLDSVSFSVREGETIALMGESGVGKTTLASLLLRFYDCHTGEIVIGGKNIKEFSEKKLRETISYAPQDLYLFNCSIKENIRFAKLNATDEEIEKAAKIAHAHDFINELPDGYDTLIGERGLKLSGGEKQRISIARAILKDAPILILDEAVSNLDSKSEELFMSSLKQLKHKTIIIITHRESTIKNANRLFLLENGRTTEKFLTNEH